MLNDLEVLSNLSGVSGEEDAIRDFLLSRLPDAKTDSRGNVLCHRSGRGKKLMCCAHMDEVGLMVTGITESGFLAFQSVGGIDARVLVSKHVRVGAQGVSGVIGMKAVHLQSAEEKAAPPKEEALFIDIGASNKAEAAKKVSVGDFVSFETAFSTLGDGLMKGKALDDRVGCAALLALLDEKEPAFDLYAVFTVGEEVGGLGARAAALSIAPEAALVLEGTTCSDVFGVHEKDTVTHLGSGVCLPARDRSMVANAALRSALIDTATRHNIPWQEKRTTAGGTDGGAIHTSGGGIPTAVLAVPCRYIHSPVSVASMTDFQAMCRLCGHFVKEGLWT